jgi:hypothetical protein
MLAENGKLMYINAAQVHFSLIINVTACVPSYTG